MRDWDGINRRSFVRMKYPCLLVLSKIGGKRISVLTHTENISAGGAYVIMKNNIELETPVEIEIDLMDMSEHIVCQGKVAWVRRRQDLKSIKPDFFDIGVEFQDINDDDKRRLEKLIEYLHKRQTEVPYK